MKREAQDEDLLEFDPNKLSKFEVREVEVELVETALRIAYALISAEVFTVRCAKKHTETIQAPA